MTGVRLGRRIMHFDSSQTDAELGFQTAPDPGVSQGRVEWLRVTRLLDWSRQNAAS